MVPAESPNRANRPGPLSPFSASDLRRGIVADLENAGPFAIRPTRHYPDPVRRSSPRCSRPPRRQDDRGRPRLAAKLLDSNWCGSPRSSGRTLRRFSPSVALTCRSLLTEQHHLRRCPPLQRVPSHMDYKIGTPGSSPNRERPTVSYVARANTICWVATCTSRNARSSQLFV